jgi:hypothetical protein
MSAPAIKATFSDFKLVRGRKIAMLIFEVPIEGADQALDTLGGVPNPAKEIWVGIAPIDPKKAVQEPANQDRERRPFASLSFAQQAAIRCEDAVFKRFILEEYGFDDTAETVRNLCQVNSRSELIKGSDAGNRWLLVESAFEVWKTV